MKDYLTREGDALRYTVSRNLALLDAVESAVPQLLGEFPVFCGLLSCRGLPIGELTEDFSRGGQVRVKEVNTLSPLDSPPPELIPKELIAASGYPIHNDDLARMCFLVDGKRRIGDLKHAFSPEAYQNPQRFDIQKVLKELDRYILDIDYEI